jgi:thioesterase DpgC
MDSVVSAPVANGDFAADAAHFSAYWLEAKQRLARLGPRPKRDPAVRMCWASTNSPS